MPFKKSATSIISRLFPALFPRALFIELIIQVVFLLNALDILSIASQSSFALSKLSIKAPVPHLTSISKESFLKLNFLLSIDEAIRGIESTLAQTSLSAYKILSAFAIFSDWLTMKKPKSLAVFSIHSSL